MCTLPKSIALFAALVLLRASGPEDGIARWIAAEADGAPSIQARESEGRMLETSKPMPIFRREFRLEKPVTAAMVFVSGLGQYELHINGQAVTNDVLRPGWTDYRKRVLYNTYDVTKLLRTGANAIGVMLGNGMYNVEGVKGRYTKFIGSFGQPKLIFRMQVHFADGSGRAIDSGKSWKTAYARSFFLRRTAERITMQGAKRRDGISRASKRKTGRRSWR